MYYIQGMEQMNVDQYREALRRKLAAYQGDKGRAPPPAQRVNQQPADSYSSFLQKQQSGQ